MHLVALLEDLVVWICLIAAVFLDVLIQIPADVFIHDRKQEEELLIHTALLQRAHTVQVNACRRSK